MDEEEKVNGRRSKLIILFVWNLIEEFFILKIFVELFVMDALETLSQFTQLQRHIDFN